jgi:hypothetical protein
MTDDASMIGFKQIVISGDGFPWIGRPACNHHGFKQIEFLDNTGTQLRRLWPPRLSWTTQDIARSGKAAAALPRAPWWIDEVSQLCRMNIFAKRDPREMTIFVDPRAGVQRFR